MAANGSHHSLASSDTATATAAETTIVIAYNNDGNDNNDNRQPSPTLSSPLPPQPSRRDSPGKQRPLSTVLSPTLVPSSASLSSYSSPLPPPPSRILNPHTPLPTGEEAANRHGNGNRNSANVIAWSPSAPPSPAEPAEPYSSSSYDPSQFVDEKAAIRFYEERSASPRFPPSRASMTPSTGSFGEAVPLYDAAFAQHPDSLNKRTSSHRHTPSYGSSQSTNPSSSQRPIFTSTSSRPVPSDLEIQRHTHHEQYTVSSNADTPTRSRNTPRSRAHTASDRPSQRSGETHRRKRRSGSTRRTRLSDASTLEGTWDASNISSTSPRHPSTSPTPARHYHTDQQYAHTLSRTTPAATLQQAFLEPPPVSRNPFSLFRRASVSQEAAHKNRHPGDSNNHHHHVSWKGDSSHPSRRGEWDNDGIQRYARNDMLEKAPYENQGGRHYRKSGYPGKNGEEPETNLFNFVDVMLNMPDIPNWKVIAMKMAKVLILMTITYFALMAMYFAAEFQSDGRLKNFDVLVVDLDRSMIASNFINFTQQDSKQPGQINWSVQTGYRDVKGVINDVDNGNYWGAIVVMPNASTALNKAVSLPDPAYDPTKAFLFIYDSGRSPLVVKPYIVASMYTQFIQFTTNFNPTWVNFVLSFAASSNTSLTPLATAPQVLGIPVAFDELDLHPPTAKIIGSATSVAYIWIFLVAGGSTYFVAHMVQPLARHASVAKTMVLVIFPLLAFLTSFSMAYTILLGIFGVPFESTGHFFLLFLGMLLLQGAVASLVLFLIFMIPVVFIPPITITFVVMNVIAVFNPVELMPSFYRWVYAMPFLNGVQISRFILMGSYNRLSYNLPILFAWIIVPMTFLPFAIARQKRLMMDALATEMRRRQHTYRNAVAHYSDAESHYYHNGQSEDDMDDSRIDKPGRRGKQSYSTQRPRSVRARHRDEDTDQDVDEGADGDQVRENGSGSESDSLSEDEEEVRSKGGHQSSRNTARTIRGLNPRPLGNGPSPSAPPESQVFDTLYHPERHVDQDRSIIDMPKLSRHPYASELVGPPTPEEVK